MYVQPDYCVYSIGKSYLRKLNLPKISCSEAITGVAAISTNI